jgi:iron complex transport system ATP-binding protein
MLLSLSDLKVSLSTRPVLKGITLDVAAGEFIGLIGPNGAGKSTLLRSALGLLRGSGTVRISGRDSSSLSARERAHHIAYLPQEREIAWAVSVETLVAFGRAPHLGLAGLSGGDVAIVDQAIRRMEIDEFRKRPATELSGGEKARVLIARALAQDAPLLLADEPTVGLDPLHQITLMRIFAELAREGRGVVASMHDLGLAARWCTRLIMIDDGRIVADGPPASVLTAERLRQVYGVTSFIAEADGGMVVQPLDLSSR